MGPFWPLIPGQNIPVPGIARRSLNRDRISHDTDQTHTHTHHIPSTRFPPHKNQIRTRMTIFMGSAMAIGITITRFWCTQLQGHSAQLWAGCSLHQLPSGRPTGSVEEQGLSKVAQKTLIEIRAGRLGTALWQSNLD